VIYQLRSLRDTLGVFQGLYIYIKEWLMTYRVLVSSIVIRNAIWNQI